MFNKKVSNPKSQRKNDQDLKILFPILEEIKEAQYKLYSKLEYSKVESLFNILANISLLHNQISYITKGSKDNQQYNRLTKLNRDNLEKSISYFFKTNLNLNESSDDTHDSLTIDHRNNSLRSLTTAINKPKQKKKEVMIPKLKNQMKLDKKYLFVNRSTNSNSQMNFTSSIVKKKRKLFKTVHSSPIKHMLSKPNYDSKMDATIIKSNSITCCNIGKNKERYKTHSMVLKTETKSLNSRQAKLYITYQSYPSFDKFCDDDPQCKELTKPSNYAKSLLKKYQNVVDIYGEELRNSVNTSQTRRPSSCMRNEETETTVPTPKIQLKLRNNSFIKITKMTLKK